MLFLCAAVFSGCRVVWHWSDDLLVGHRTGTVCHVTLFLADRSINQAGMGKIWNQKVLNLLIDLNHSFFLVSLFFVVIHVLTHYLISFLKNLLVGSVVLPSPSSSSLPIYYFLSLFSLSPSHTHSLSLSCTQCHV